MLIGGYSYTDGNGRYLCKGLGVRFVVVIAITLLSASHPNCGIRQRLFIRSARTSLLACLSLLVRVLISSSVSPICVAVRLSVSACAAWILEWH